MKGTRNMRQALIALCAVAALLAASADLKSQVVTPTPPASGSDAWYTQRIIASFMIGNSSSVELDRRVGWNIKSTGWAGFVTTYVKPTLDWGCRRIELHLPFGAQSNEPMDVDGYVEAQAFGLSWLTTGFVEAWAPVIRGDYTNGEKVEVIAYMGSIRADKSMTALMSESGSKVVDSTGKQIGWMSTNYNAVNLNHYVMGKAVPGDRDGVVKNSAGAVIGYACGGAKWKARIDASFAPVLKAGMSLGYDGASVWPPYHPAYAYLKSLEAKGFRNYIETWPDIRNPQIWNNANIIVANYSWYSTWFMASGWPVRRTNLTGELIRYIERPGKTLRFDSRGNPVGSSTKTVINADGAPAKVPLTWADVHYGFDETVLSLAHNYTVIVDVRFMANNGYTLKQVCDGARAAALAP